MTRILIGTASWTDKSLIDSGQFYPPAITTAEERLRYYAPQFPLVEVDGAYYALPSARNAMLEGEALATLILNHIRCTPEKLRGAGIRGSPQGHAAGYRGC
jgi:Protein of unknown function DUF72